MEIILYDVVLPKLVCVQINFVKIVSILFLLTPRNWNYQTFCVQVYTLHSDEVVSLLISGCEIVVYNCSPMTVTFYALLLNRWFILTLTLVSR